MFDGGAGLPLLIACDIGSDSELKLCLSYWLGWVVGLILRHRLGFVVFEVVEVVVVVGSNSSGSSSSSSRRCKPCERPGMMVSDTIGGMVQVLNFKIGILKHARQVLKEIKKTKHIPEVIKLANFEE